MQIAAVNNVLVSRKGNGTLSGDSADAGGFDMAMAAMLALLNPQPPGASQVSAGSGDDSINAQIAGTSSGGFVDVPIVSGELPGNMLIVRPASSQQDAESVGGEALVNSNTTTEIAQIPMPEVLPDTTQVITVTNSPEGLINQSPGVLPDTAQTITVTTQNIAVTNSPESLINQSPEMLPDTAQAITVTTSPEDLINQSPDVPPDTAQAIIVTTLPESIANQSADLTGQTTQAVLFTEVEGEAQNNQAIAGNSAITVQPGDTAKVQPPATDNNIFASVVISEAGNVSDSQGVPGKNSAVQDIQSDNVSFVPISEATYVADSSVNNDIGQSLQVVSDAGNANAVVAGVNTTETDNVVTTQSEPENVNNPASGSIAAGEPQLTSEKKIVTFVSENAVIKPDVENQSGVVTAEQQRNPELAYQGGNENKLLNNKPKGPQTADESKNIISNDTVPAGKVDSNNGLGTGNTTDNSAQFPAQVATDSLKGVPLSNLRDRVLQEIRHVYNNIGNDNRQTQVQLKLEPEQLGQLTIKLYFHKGELNAHFYTANNSVKEVLEGSLQQLRTSLGQQDLKLNEAFVFVGNGSQDNSNFYYQGRNQSGTVQFGSNNYHKDSDIPVEPAQSGRTETGSSSRQVDYLV
ncbi:flagellar hook-length control protein FliK [Pelotomaculum isophthalicicum JI]|uniref:Flagellar hook-length control protein FliK n=1 Tax=Pelotomaculum isophthalicicum JI TaxID=947010 RepID=A0A9X4GZY5_9FIRM|nr:flagellar hook-length control protein FliK [Pelotomaculum isophthalicicum]MDF9409305.1 flagellar hook-length control protein FliK [Pelotomaculum isophthalicicum JI]